MPQIIVTADSRTDSDDRAVMFTERVNVSDFASPHFQSQLVERLGWAVGDVQVIEQEPRRPRSVDREPAADRSRRLVAVSSRM